MSGNNRYVIGLNCSGFISSACLVKDGVVVSAICEERISRLKRDKNFPVKAIKYDYLITICDISTINIPTNLKWEKVYDLKITESAIVDDDHTTILNKFRGTREQIKKSILHFIGKELNTQTHEEFFVA